MEVQLDGSLPEADTPEEELTVMKRKQNMTSTKTTKTDLNPLTKMNLEVTNETNSHTYFLCFVKCLMLP